MKVEPYEYQIFKNLIDNTSEIIQTVDTNGNFIFVNKAWFNILGYSRRELDSLHLNDIIHPEHKNHCKTLFNDVQKSDGSLMVETAFITKKGAKIYVEGSIHRICEDNRILYIQCIFRDITEKKIYMDIIESAINEWRITFDTMPCGVLLVDLDCIIKRANRYFANMFKLQIEDIKGLTCQEVLRDEKLQNILTRITCEKKFPLEAIQYDLTEFNKSFVVNFTPIPANDGITRSFIVTFVDITETKNKERKLIESRDAFFNMLKDLDYSYKELKGLFEGLVRSFINVIEAKSPWTKGHSERVTDYALSIAEALHFDEEELNNLKIAALLHDIGKIGTYDLLLDNPNRLTEEELKLIYMHPIKGENILKPIKQMKKILPIIRHHHERIDGAGYPDGLKGDEIPLAARILSIADAFDSMTSNRPYRNAGTYKYAISELKNCSGTQFDSDIVEVFLKILDKSIIYKETAKAQVAFSNNNYLQ